MQFAQGRSHATLRYENDLLSSSFWTSYPALFEDEGFSEHIGLVFAAQAPCKAEAEMLRSF